MKKIITNFAVILMLICASSAGLFAQTFCLQMTEVSNDGTTLVLDITMSGNVDFALGTSNLQFAGTNGAYGPATLVSSPLLPPTYFTPTITQPIAGSNSINLELAFPGTGSIAPVDPASLLIAQISLPILDAALAADGLDWSYTGSTTQTVVFLDDEDTQLFATDPMCLEGYMPAGAAIANVRLFNVNQGLNQITFKNFGGTDQDISDWRLCSNFKYTFSGMVGDANIAIIAGDYNLSAGEEMTVAWTPTGGFRATGDDIGLYLPAGGFTNPAAMVDFMQYLSAGNGRESVAVMKGIWGTGDFVSSGSPYNFIGTGVDTGLSFWSGLAVDGCTDATAANYDPAATNDDGSCLYDVTFNVDMNCESGFIEPALEGPLFGWCGGCVPLTDPDLDGIWSTTVQIPAGPFEYKYAVDAFASQENLVDDMINGGTCAPITDFASFANRQVEVVAGLVLNDTYGTCGICDPTVGCTDPAANNFSATAVTDDGSCLYDVTFNVDLSCYDGNDPNIDVGTPGGFTTIAIEGPSLGWCGSCVTLVDNGSGIWSVTLTLPAGPFEYKYAHDIFAGQEQLVDDMVNGGSCAPITDFDAFANREIIIPTTLTTNDTYGSCDACPSDCPTDFNLDGTTNGDDFSIFLGNFGLSCPVVGPCPTDLNVDGITNGDDFSIFLGNFGLDCI